MDADGNRDWCAQLYERRGSGLLLYARSLGLNQSEAEDVLQETFQALLQREAPPDQEDRYVLRAVRNRALNYRRSLKRRLRREHQSDHWFEPTPDRADHEEVAMRKLATLPQKQREVIVLKIWNNHTWDTIGDLLGISPNTAAARYRYGLQKLRTALQQEEDRNERPRVGRNRGLPGHLDTQTPVHGPLSPGFASPASLTS